MKRFNQDLLSNRSFAAMARDDEMEAARKADPPVNLRSVPLEEWDQHIEFDVTLPPELQTYLDGREPGPLTKDEIDGLEDQIAAFHEVKPPYHIVCALTLQTTGRPWLHVPEVAPYVTGFYLERFQ